MENIDADDKKSKEKNVYTDWKFTTVKNKSQEREYGGFLRMKNMENPNRIYGQFCYQPDGNGKIMDIQPNLITVNVSGEYETIFKGSVINVKHDDGRIQSIFIPNRLRHEDKLLFFHTSDIMAIDGDKTPSND